MEIREGVFDRDRNGDGKIQKNELVKCANVFRAKDNEMLKSVGILADRPNSLAEYWIYLLKEGYTNPEDGELLYSAVGDHCDSEVECYADNGDCSPSKSSSPQTGDNTADGMPVCALLIMLSLAGIVTVKRRAQREHGV